jgi:hypothetical protein
MRLADSKGWIVFAESMAMAMAEKQNGSVVEQKRMFVCVPIFASSDK